jgi:hypothetical protein
MNDAEKLKLEQELKKAAPVLNRLGDGPSPLPDHVRARLNAALDRKIAASSPAVEAKPADNRRPAPEREPSWLEVWRWWVGLATATAAIALIVVLNRPGPNLPPVIQVAMLDSVGTVRGTGVQPMELLQQQWKAVKPQEFDDAAKLKQWQEDWSTGGKGTVVRVIYDRDAGELKVLKIVEGKVVQREALAVSDERVLPEKLKAIEQLIKAWTTANSRK